MKSSFSILSEQNREKNTWFQTVRDSHKLAIKEVANLFHSPEQLSRVTKYLDEYDRKFQLASSQLSSSIRTHTEGKQLAVDLISQSVLFVFACCLEFFSLILCFVVHSHYENKDEL